MDLPFTTEQFFEVFGAYNQQLWPSQFLLLALALLAIYCVLKPRSWSGVVVSAILALLWAWLGIAYHWAFFLRINPLAIVFTAFSLAGATVFLWQGVVKRQLKFAWAGNVPSFSGAALVLFSLLIYPLWSVGVGHTYPAMPTFGLPCPTTIFTIGILAFLVPPYPRSPFLVPVAWCFVGAQAAFLLGVTQDLALIVTGVMGILLAFKARSKQL